MLKDGKRVRAVHHFPDDFTENLNCSSPELLQQVRVRMRRRNARPKQGSRKQMLKALFTHAMESVSTLSVFQENVFE